MSDKKYGLFHLVSGQVMIAEFTLTEDGVFDLTRPLDVMVQQHPQGVAVGFVPHATMGGVLPAREQRQLPNEAVMYVDEVPQQILDGYLQATSKIQIAHNMPRGPAAANGKLIV